MSLSRAEDPEGAENEDCHYLARRTQRILYQWWPIDVWSMRDALWLARGGILQCHLSIVNFQFSIIL
jgi:hypothetical protein